MSGQRWRWGWRRCRGRGRDGRWVGGRCEDVVSVGSVGGIEAEGMRRSAPKVLDAFDGKCPGNLSKVPLSLF